ncbi:MAG: glutaredoxin family protein [Steroidobacteraceae bacterium]
MPDACATPPFLLYVRDGCHLCDQFLLELGLDFPALRASVETVDVDADPALATAYGLRVPVLAGAGGVLCEGRYDRAEVAAALGL